MPRKMDCGAGTGRDCEEEAAGAENGEVPEVPSDSPLRQFPGDAGRGFPMMELGIRGFG